MKVVVYFDTSQPKQVRVLIPDRSMGGTKETHEFDLWDALQLRDELVRLFGPGPR